MNPNLRLSSVTIPESVITISSYIDTTSNPSNTTRTGAFQNLTSLTDIYFSGSNLRVIGDNAFNGCVNLNPVQLPDSVTTLGDNAFNGAFVNNAAGKDFNFTAPSQLKYIGANAFSNSNLASFTLGKATNVQIGAGAFTGCDKLTSLNLSNVAIAPLSESAFANSSFTKLSFTNGKSTVEKGELALPASLLNTTTFPGAVTTNPGNGLTIGTQNTAFGGSDIATVEFGENINMDVLPSFIFAGMSKLATINNLPKSIKRLNQYSLAGTAITSFDDKSG